MEERETRGIDDVYLLRVEQLYPFPLKALVHELSRFKKADIVWCQEEPKNMGSWSFVEPYIEWVLGQTGLKTKRAPLCRQTGFGGDGDRPDVQNTAQLKAFPKRLSDWRATRDDIDRNRFSARKGIVQRS